MNLSQRHQELLNSFKEPFKVKDGEEGYFHILFVKIVDPGKHPRSVPMVQIFSVKDWGQIKQTIEKSGIAVTQYDEYSVIHDPTKTKAEELEKAAKAEKAKADKEAAEAAAKKAEKEAKADELAAKKAEEKAAKDKAKAEAAEKKKAEAEAETEAKN